jgi:hypothetical protein
LELFSLEGLAAHVGDADTEASSSLGTLEVPDDEVGGVSNSVRKLGMMAQMEASTLFHSVCSSLGSQ